MQFLDTHCHLDFPQFADAESVLARAAAAGVMRAITIGCEPLAWARTLAFTKSHPQLFAALGVHPEGVEEDFDAVFSELEKLAADPRVVAIGETGLDFFRPENPAREKQEKAFAAHVALAKKLGKPVIVHLRNARAEALEFFARSHDFPFVLHCFVEDWEFAEQMLAYGGYLSFTGVITFKNAAPELLEVVRRTPLDRILIETDAPFLAPHPHRGQPNEPAFVVEIARKIAELKNLSLAEVAAATTANAENFFRLKK